MHIQNSENVLTVAELFENPEKFVGKTIHVRGYYQNDLEDNALYPSKEKSGNIDRSIWIDESEATIYINSNGEKIKPYAVGHETVIITGKFYFRHRRVDDVWFDGFGYGNFWQARLTDISSIQKQLDSIPALEMLIKK